MRMRMRMRMMTRGRLAAWVIVALKTNVETKKIKINEDNHKDEEQGYH